MATLRSKRRRRGRLLAIVPAHPAGIEDDAARKVIRRHRAGLLKVLAAIGPELRLTFRRDAHEPTPPAGDVQKLIDLITGAFSAYVEGFDDDDVAAIIEDHADQIDVFNRRQIDGVLERVPGVDPIGEDHEAITDDIRKTVETSVAKIKGIRAGLREDLTNTITDAFARGDRPTEVAKKIRKRWRVSESRIVFIVQNEIGNLNAAANKIRQTSVGVTHYFWETSKDERVRPSHVELQGKRFAWTAPPSVGHPGEDFRCRCRPRPDLSTVIDGLEEDTPPEEEATPLRSRRRRRRPAAA